MKNKVLLFSFILIIIGGAWYINNLSQKENVGFPWSVEKQREYASDLFNQGLYRQSAEEYAKLIFSPGLTVKERANLAYLVGNIYLENLSDYRLALSKYLLIKTIAPGFQLINEVDRKVVECLERMGRTLDAKAVLSERVNLQKYEPKPKDEVVAKLGERVITRADLEARIGDLPPYLQNQYKDEKKKLEFLRQYLAQELLYEAAKRRGLDKDGDVIRQTFEMKKGLMVGKLLEEEVRDKCNVTDKEVELYYNAHKDEFKWEGKIRSLQEVRPEIESAIQREKEEEEVKKLIQKLLTGEEVEIYEDRFKDSKDSSGE